MKKNHGMLAGVLWIALQNGLLAQGSVYPENRHPVLPGNAPVRQETGMRMSGESVRDCCEKLAGDKRRIYYLTAWNDRVLLELTGVYSRADMLFMKVLLINRSGVDYSIDSLRFVIRDSQHETGEERVTPFYVYGNAKMIKTQGTELYVFALPKFALPGKKHLDIELLEKKGGRHLRLKVGKRAILRARFV